MLPEVNPETYYPDNSRVSCEITDNTLTLMPPVTPFGKEFTMIIEMNEASPVVKITHKIRNISEKKAEFAPWSVTSLTHGGVCIIPMSTQKKGYLPNRVISLWDYSDINDSRFRITNSEVRIRQDSYVRKAFKAGFNLEDGYAAYAVNGQIFANVSRNTRRYAIPIIPAILRYIPTACSLNVSFWEKKESLRRMRKQSFQSTGACWITKVILSRI